jgi:hypothetical protein
MHFHESTRNGSREKMIRNTYIQGAATENLLSDDPKFPQSPAFAAIAPPSPKSD